MGQVDRTSVQVRPLTPAEHRLVHRRDAEGRLANLQREQQACRLEYDTLAAERSPLLRYLHRGRRQELARRLIDLEADLWIAEYHLVLRELTDQVCESALAQDAGGAVADVLHDDGLQRTG